MIKPPPAILQSRVGKRLFLLFVACALVPLGVMAVLSLSQVRDLLIDQGKTRLAGIAKSYALGVYERMLTARDMALIVASQPVVSAPVPASIAHQFLFLGRFDADGRVEAIMGNPPVDAEKLVTEYRDMASPPATMARSADGEKLFLLHNLRSSGGRGILVGELNPAYLWGDADELKADTIICVVDSTRMQYVRCPNGRELDLPRLLRNAGPNSEPTDVVWTREGVSYRGRVWAQFMTNDFASKDWYFAVSVPEDDLLAVVYAFRRSFLGVVVLALLLIIWFSGRQIRAMLTPLDSLTAGTRRIADNDFSTRVKVSSDDEFGELGEAFNSMSVRLGRQYQISLAHADIDRMILGRADLERIVEKTLHYFRTLDPALTVYAFLLDRVEPKHGRRFSLRGESIGTDDVLHAESIPLTPRPKLDGTGLSRRDTRDVTPAWMPITEVAGSAAQWIQPLLWGRAVCGWLLIIESNRAAIGDDARDTIGELAGRLALAISSAWREDELYQQAHFDPLTGLPNRLLFSDRLQREIARGRRESRISAVLFVDLDNFKAVNDSQGHGAGDFLLCEAAVRIASTIRESDTVSRHGGDEFTVMLADIHEHRFALRVGDAIIAALSAPFTVAGQDCFLSASVGISIHPDNGQTVEELLKNADTAMYRAKSAGRGQSLFFEERMNAETVARLAIDRELRQALERGELELFYQPQVSLDKNQVATAEALVRWNHPKRGLIGPEQFIAVAEESGLIVAVGRWVIEEACRQIVAWRRDGLALDKISVNVSARQFRDADFVEHILDNVVPNELASSIEFEITETAMLDRMDLLEDKLQALADAGCTVALDDFGTGFSSMAYLKKLTVHTVKIDRTFVEDIDKSAQSLAFVEAIIAMAHALGKSVVAEGAENIHQVQLLRERGCDLVQGYHFSKPLPASAFLSFAKSFGRP